MTAGGRMRRADYKALIAPYHHFRPSTYYDSFVPGGCYEGAIQGCPWRCDGCWSRFGYVGDRVAMELSPEQVVAKLLTGMTRNGKAGARITGGEVAYWWPHVHAVLGEFLERTRDEVIIVPGLTSRRGVEQVIVLETSGGMKIASPAELEAEHGTEAGRIVLSVGMKASSAERLQSLTGLGAGAAAAAHARQRALLEQLTTCEHVQYVVTFLDRFVAEEELAPLRELIESTDRGGMSVFPFRRYPGAPRRQT